MTYYSVKCNLCNQSSSVVGDFFHTDRECLVFQCSNKSCNNIFELNYNDYIYSCWEEINADLCKQGKNFGKEMS